MLGVLFLLFLLFFAVTEPEDIARKALGDKAPPEAIAVWLENHGYDRPLWPWQDWGDNLLFDHYRRMLTFDFGLSDQKEEYTRGFRDTAGVVSEEGVFLSGSGLWSSRPLQWKK